MNSNKTKVSPWVDSFELHGFRLMPFFEFTNIPLMNRNIQMELSEELEYITEEQYCSMKNRLFTHHCIDLKTGEYDISNNPKAILIPAWAN